MESQKHPKRILLHILAAPFIYSLTIPFAVADVWVEIYHRICFPCYNLPYVKRNKYIRIDRQKLQYLNFVEKLNCMYCGYVNGLINYMRVIAGETEKYWCSIKHKPGGDFQEPDHHKDFLEYGDEDSYRNFLKSSS